MGVKAATSEDVEQRVLAEWLNLRGLLWCHVPNGGARHVATAVRLKGLGVKAGVPDIMIFDKPPRHPAARGVAIEMKRCTGGVVSLAQRSWAQELQARGWLFCVARGASDAIRWCQELGF